MLLCVLEVSSLMMVFATYCWAPPSPAERGWGQAIRCIFFLANLWMYPGLRLSMPDMTNARWAKKKDAAAILGAG